MTAFHGHTSQPGQFRVHINFHLSDPQQHQTVCVCVLQVDFESLQNAQISGKFVNVPEEEEKEAHSGECECEVSMLQ